VSGQAAHGIGVLLTTDATARRDKSDGKDNDQGDPSSSQGKST